MSELISSPLYKLTFILTQGAFILPALLKDHKILALLGI